MGGPLKRREAAKLMQVELFTSTTTVITAAINSSGNTNIQCLERSVSETQSNRLTVHDLSASYPCLGPLSDWTALPRDTCGERPAFYIHARAAT